MTIRTTLLTVCLLVVSVSAGGIATATGPGTASPAQVGSVAAAQSNCSFPVSKTDATDTEVTLDSKPERIVVLQPSDAQLVWEIGAQDRVVGMPRTQYTAYLDGRNETTNIKNKDLSVNIEQVVGLQPDIVFASNITDAATVRELRRAGITVYHFDQVKSLEEIAGNIETVGELVGSCEAGTSRANEFRLQVATVEKAAEEAEQRPTVLYYFFGMTAGNGTHIHDVIQTAGGDNVATAAGIDGYGQLSPEVAVDQNPQWIVHPGHAALPDDPAYNETTAMKQQQTIELNADYISQPGPRVVIPLTRLAKQWHPGELAIANETITMANVTTPTETATTKDTSSDGPWFGIGVGVAALLAVALLARRQ